MDFGDYKYRIQQAKQRLPLPKLMALHGDKCLVSTSMTCPFHDDEHPSFSVRKNERGLWFWNCFAGCGHGDEIDYLMVKLDMTKGEAICEYIQLAGLWTD